MGLLPEEIHNILKEQFADRVVESDSGVEPFVVMKPEGFEEVAFFCRDDSRLQLDLLSLISGVDYPDRDVIEAVYCLDSTSLLHRLVIKVPLARDNPSIRTVENVWRTADWHERETFDLVGIQFEGHHNLIRILCAEDWVGHPLRKDYVMPESYHGLKNVVY